MTREHVLCAFGGNQTVRRARSITRGLAWRPSCSHTTFFLCLLFPRIISYNPRMTLRSPMQTHNPTLPVMPRMQNVKDSFKRWAHDFGSSNLKKLKHKWLASLQRFYILYSTTTATVFTTAALQMGPISEYAQGTCLWKYASKSQYLLRAPRKGHIAGSHWYQRVCGRL